MSWSCGLVGLPNAGKSTLFKALTALDVTIESYPFSTVEPNKAIVPLPDQRLHNLARLCKSKKTTPAVIEIIDVAGLVKGANRGEGLGNQFLGHLRNVDVLIHVVAGYDNENFYPGQTVERFETVNLELILADLEVVNRRRQKVEPKLRCGEQEAKKEMQLIKCLENALSRGTSIRELSFSVEEKYFLEKLSLLTLKEMLYVYNLDEDSFLLPDLSSFPPGSTIVALCAGLEAELVELPAEDRQSFLEAYGIDRSQTLLLLEVCYKRLELLTFYTIKGEEARAWVVPVGTKAIKAAGKVHTDMEKGFINVEVVNWKDLVSCGDLFRSREKGLCRVEGRDYIVQEGDVLLFRFRR